MDKILIVGHPQSGHDTIERLMASAGMALARPSRREGLRPDEISSALCRADTRTLLEAPDEDGALRQLDIGPVWQGLALDLMLGNIDQPTWGWSDPQSVVLLDYWREIDPGITFVLVYDGQDSVLADMTVEEARQLTPDGLARHLRNWSVFNATLLRFYLHHPGRCLLVQARQACATPQVFLQQVQARLRGTGQLHAVSELPARPAPKADSPAWSFLTDTLLCQHPECVHLYEALQASANLPETRTHSDRTAALLSAWLDLADLSQDRLEQRQHLTTCHTRIGELEQCLHHRDTVIEQQQQRALALEAQEQASQQERAQSSAQLHQLRLALETQGQQRQQLSAKVLSLTEALERNEQVVTERQEQITRLDLQLTRQQQLLAERESALQGASVRIERLQAAQAQQATQAQQAAQAQQVAQAQQAALAQQVQAGQQAQEQLVGQLHQVQLELETHYLQRQQLTADVQSLTAELERTRQLATQHQAQVTLLNRQLDGHQQTLAERDAGLKSAGARLQQLQEERNRQEQAQKHQAATHQAAVNRIDRLIQKGDRLQAQMQAQKDSHQARLKEATAANTALAQENAELLTQLHQVQQELERHFMALQQLREEQARARAAIPPAPTGAPERVKSHLSYRLGATMIQHSGSVTGWIRMPFALFRVTRQYRKEHRSREAVKLPPLHKYRDAQEAERVKRHLSYRLGQTLVKHAATPLGWLSLPFALQREVKDFRLQRQH